ncbi:hypothetical protein DPMN_162394 [Dreissena polymorpha]|uniref:Uncharacterized protein n=1 Tax=Dreissena polymorpha TaxID=45954 RepID=A0A9D4EUS6_DREPO|nr:hypothetical protein DPMN_162394 [Dreissena polymorpha]
MVSLLQQHHIIHHCGTVGRQHPGVQSGIVCTLLQDNDAEDVVDKNDLNTQKDSTTIDIELAQQQHQSGLQEPQSRTTHPLP